MKRIFILLIPIVLGVGCSEESELPLPAQSPFYLRGILNGEFWSGEVFDTYVDDLGQLIINSQVESQKEGVEIEQITLHIPDFQGEGRYSLSNPGGMYREWCCLDQLVTGVWTQPAVGDTGLVLIESFQASSGEIRGTVFFTASQEGQDPSIFEQGEFYCQLEE